MDNRRIREFKFVSDKLGLLSFGCDSTLRKWSHLSTPLLLLLDLDEKEMNEDPEKWISLVQRIRRESILERLDEFAIDREKFSVEIPFSLSCGDVLLGMTFCPLISPEGTSFCLCSAEDITEEKLYKQEAIKSRDSEIEISARIQKTLLTGVYRYSDDSLQICADTLPSSKVDGDFYEFISLSDHSMDFIIGDVMGKGVPAALLSAAVKTSFFKAVINRAVLRNSTPGIGEILSDINSHIASELVALNKFLTLYYCRIDTEASSLSFIDAGHTSIIYYCAADKCCWSIKGSNMPVGFTESQDFRVYELPLGKGDLLFFYSDGITEVENSEKSQFGYERLEQLIYAHRHLAPDDLISKVLNVTFFYASDNFRDDVTVVAARISGEAPYSLEREIPALSNPEKMDLTAIRNNLSSDMRESEDAGESEANSRLLIAYIEALTNCMKFTEGPLLTGWKISRRRYSLYIDFSGPDFDWSSWREPDLHSYQNSGFGMYLINQAVDSFLLLKGTGRRKKIIMIRERL